VGCGDATVQGPDGAMVTVSCAEGDTGFIYDGDAGVRAKGNQPRSDARIPVKIMMNVGNPDRAFDFACYPTGVSGSHVWSSSSTA
jgi:pyruvate, water dikinase